MTNADKRRAHACAYHDTKRPQQNDNVELSNSWYSAWLQVARSLLKIASRLINVDIGCAFRLQYGRRRT